MAAKGDKKTRYRRIRSGILTASILAILPVMGFMKGGLASTASASTAAQPTSASVQSASASPATSSQTSKTSTTVATHTRTRAS